VTETGGQYSETRETAINPDPEAYAGICFSDVPEGQFNIGAAIPDNYNPTMSLTYTLDVNAGDRAFVDFGAQSRETPAAQSADPKQGGGVSPILGIAGGVLLLGGAGLGWYALRLRNPRGRLGSGGLCGECRRPCSAGLATKRPCMRLVAKQMHVEMKDT
jgi:hypothetical protein